MIRALRVLIATVVAVTFSVSARMEPALATNANCTNVAANAASPVVGPLSNVNLKCDANGNVLTTNQAGTYPAVLSSTPYGLSLLTNSFYGLAGYSVNGGGSGTQYGSGVDLLTDGISGGPAGGGGLLLGTPGILYVQGIGPNGAVPIFSSTGFPITDSTLTYTADVANYAAGDSKGAMRVGGYNATTAGTTPLLMDSSGYLNVHVQAGGSTTFPYSGTSSGQTATTASFLGEAGVYNSSPPTLTNTQVSPVQLDVNGYQKVNVSAGTVAATQSGTWNIGSITTLPAVALTTGSSTIGALTANQSVNTNQIGGNAVNSGIGASTAASVGNGTQRVAVSSDSQVGSASAMVSLTPTVQNAAYSAGQGMGGVLAFANAFRTPHTGVLESISISLKSTQTTAFKVYVFNDNPTNSTFTDKVSPNINALDIPKLVGVYTLSNNDSGLSLGGGTGTIYNLDGIGKQVYSAGSTGTATTLYCVLLTVSGYTPPTTSDVNIEVGILQD